MNRLDIGIKLNRGVMTLTLTQVLKEREQLMLFGHVLADLPTRGDLGLGLDPEGPVQFARIHGRGHVGGERIGLPHPLLLAVYGPGRVEGTDQANWPGERCWHVCRGDITLRLDIQRGPIDTLLPAVG